MSAVKVRTYKPVVLKELGFQFHIMSAVKVCTYKLVVLKEPKFQFHIMSAVKECTYKPVVLKEPGFQFHIMSAVKVPIHPLYLKNLEKCDYRNISALHMIKLIKIQHIIIV